ncbi:transglutaminase TgpA family protein [Alkalibacillus haloalkaliphilus]|uniref:transglutaminase TgpA family protein n=1 Tax=Alkalibacillus haloalkaliphilus TaxID=94136 RepID=UPI0002FDE48A|nr:transglutaminaseTgpA domain-containing protein [Alkalibacillus haloalkaliphilus]
MRLKDMSSSKWVGIALYIGSMLLLMEWVLPLGQVTDTGGTHLFIIYIVFCFVISLIQLPMWIAPFLKLAGLMFLLNYIFYEPSFFSLAWLGELLVDLQLSTQALLGQSWIELTPVFRTLLFLILLWMMSYLLYYWFVVVKRPFSFVLLTFVYVTALDTFTLYDGNVAIVRVFIFSVLILILANLNRIVDQEKIKVPSSRTMAKWIAPMAIVVFISAAIGFAAPKFEPQWPDPVSFIQAAGQNGFGSGEGSGGVNRVGYGEHDDRLGGGFIMDDTTVFYATATSPRYWKVETKDEYTGHGWVRSDEGTPTTNESGHFPHISYYGESVERNETEAELQFIEPGHLNKIPYLYGTETVGTTVDGVSFYYNYTTGELASMINEEQDLVDEGYSLEVGRPDFPRNKMREVPVGYVESDQMPERYLQLPDDLPERVSNLAEEIVEDVDENRYDYARAIESYFEDSGFEYATSDVAIPDDDEDYVDQFLFDTQRGYCDNYSTSMVVMLRSLEIPARWAKGFTGGERAVQQDAFPERGSNVFEIQNNNAHSWVEVYFPEVGWVPFEPTVGFDNQANFSTGESVDDILDGNNNEDDPLEAPENDDQSDMDDLLDEGSESEEDETVGSGGQDSNFNLLHLFAITIGTLLTIWLIYMYRSKIVASWKKQKLKRKPSAKTITNSYQFILKLLEREGYQFQSGETLREYAYNVDSMLGNKQMTELTLYYERFVYREEDLNSEVDQFYQTWRNLTKQILSK